MTERARMPLPFYVVAGAFVVAMVAIAAVAAWPIYASGSFVVLVVVSLVVGGAIAALGTIRRFGAVTVALLAIAAYLVLGVPVAVPSALTDLLAVARGWVDLLVGSVFGWKELVTVSMPVGSYQALLAPAFMVFLFGTTAALSLVWRTRSLSFLAVVTGLLMQAFGLVFGASAVSDTATVAILSIRAPRELVLGVLGFVVALAFLLWRAGYVRRQAILAAQSTAGLRQGRESSASVARRVGLAVAMVLVAVIVASAAGPALGSGSSRSVLRVAVEPVVAEAPVTSPLSEYRDYLKNEYTTDLFDVSTSGDEPVRIRLATLSHYDGRYFRAIDPATPAGTDESAFVRIPYTIDPTEDGLPVSVTVTMDGYSGIWMPTAGQLVKADFSGPNAAALSDGFFYNTGSSAGIETTAFTPGDSYTVDAVVPQPSVDATTLTAPDAGATLDADLVPEQLVEWVRLQGGVPFSELVSRLIQRGFLSHTVDKADDPADLQPWVADLGQYTWSPSEAGHSIERIDTLFSQLIEQQELGYVEPKDLVSGVGDDEQFATAIALIARHLGFSSRVVLGFRVGGTDAPDAIPACVDVCQGRNLTAWTEVQDGATGEWVTIDATPQHTLPLADIVTDQRSPEVATVVTPITAELEEPPAAAPNASDVAAPEEQDAEVDLSWLADLLRTVGLSLLLVLVVLAPFATILIAKVRRRSGRRKAADVETRIVGGWDEYVDAALDHGYPTPTTETRTQVAKVFRTPNGLALATIADRAVFGPLEPPDADSDRFWELLDQETLALARGMKWWQRWRAALSLRSFLRYLRARPDRAGGSRVTPPRAGR